MNAALFLPFLLAGPTPSVAVVPQDPPIEIWINNDRQFTPGDAVDIQVRTRDDGYLVVLNADPDGNVRVLFPINPDDDNFVRGGKRYDVKGRGDRQTFEADITGRGTVYAAVSPTRFQFSPFTTGNHWNEHALAPQRLPREPESELTTLVQSMAGESFDYDILSYDVAERNYATDSYAPTYAYPYASPYPYGYGYGYGGYGYGYPYGYGYGYPYAYRYGYPYPYSSFYGCDPFFPSYSCGSSFAFSFGLGSGSFVSPFFYQPVYVQRHRFNNAVFINKNRFGVHDRFFGYRDRRFSGAASGFDRAFVGTTPRRSVGTPARSTPRSSGFEAQPGRTWSGRRADIPGRSTAPTRATSGAADRSLGERRGIEARRAQPNRGEVNQPAAARANDRAPEARRVERRDDAAPARSSERPVAQPRRTEVERQPAPPPRDVTPRRATSERSAPADRGQSVERRGSSSMGGESRGMGSSRPESRGGGDMRSGGGGGAGGGGGGRRR